MESDFKGLLTPEPVLKKFQRKNSENLVGPAMELTLQAGLAATANLELNRVLSAEGKAGNEDLAVQPLLISPELGMTLGYALVKQHAEVSVAWID